MEDCVGRRTRSAYRGERESNDANQEGDQSATDAVGGRGVHSDLREIAKRVLHAAKGGMYQRIRDSNRSMSMMSPDSTQDVLDECPVKTEEEDNVSHDDDGGQMGKCTLEPTDESSDDDGTGGGERQCTMDDRPGEPIGRIRERYVVDSRGWWVVFDVPSDHYLHGCYAETLPNLIPKDAHVEVIRGILPGSMIDTGTKKGRRPDSDTDELGFRRMFGDAATSSDGATPPKTEGKQDGLQGDAKIKALEEELRKVKERLALKPKTDKKVSLHEEATTAAESVYETMDDGIARTKSVPSKYRGGESYSEYETGKDSDYPRKGLLRSSTRMKKQKRASRRSGSDTDASRGSWTEETIASVVKRCIASSLTPILEEKLSSARTTKGENDGKVTPSKTGMGDSQSSATTEDRSTRVESMGAGDRQAAGDQNLCNTFQGGFNPHMMPLMKFKGENWEDFIEHFDSFADACGMTPTYKLQYLLMSLEGKPRSYAKKEEGEPFTYASVRQRLQHRYGKKESAFEIRHQLRSVKRRPGEPLEEFSDRLQEIAQQGTLDDKDRDELFYFAFLNAVGDIPKMQYYIEQAHAKNRNLKLSDLLALAREYLEKSPTARRRSVAVNVCKPITQRKGRLEHEDEEVVTDVEREVGKIEQEKRERKEVSLATMRKDIGYLLTESEFHNKCIKYNGLHYNLKEKGKNFKGTLRPRDAPPLDRYSTDAEAKKFRPRGPTGSASEHERNEAKAAVAAHCLAVDPPQKE